MTAVGGVILLAFGIFPKMGHLVASVPSFVLGGAGIVMFGMVAATGIKILAGVDYQRYKAAPYVVAISIGVGMIPLVADKFFQRMPKALSPAAALGHPARVDRRGGAEPLLPRREVEGRGGAGSRRGSASRGSGLSQDRGAGPRAEDRAACVDSHRRSAGTGADAQDWGLPTGSPRRAADRSVHGSC